MSNFFVQELVLYRHFMLIDSPIPFELVANPTNYRKDEQGHILNSDLSEITGRDICSRPAGAWRVDCWTLLPEKYHKQNPVFTMLIKYDRDLLEEGEIVDIRYSDIDIGEGVAGVNGQLVDIPASAFRPVVNAIKSASASLADKFDEQNIFLSEINSTVDSVSDDVSTIRTDVVDVSNDTFAIKSDVGELVRLLGSLENGTVLNVLEQIRTVLKSPSSAGASTPWGSILTSLLRVITAIESSSYLSVPDEEMIWLAEGSNLRFYVDGEFKVYNSSLAVIGVVSGTFFVTCYGKTVSYSLNHNAYSNIFAISIRGGVHFF